MDIRRCSICTEYKPIEVFTLLGGKRTGNRSSTCVPCRVKYNKQRRVDNPEHVGTIERRSKFKKQYGITLQDYEDMLDGQNGGCAVCGTKKPSDRTRYFAVDHCHTTGQVRGLLCTKCNRGLGLFNDDTDRMFRAINYLKGVFPWQ